MRITVNSQVSTECWRFDKKCSSVESRWSYSIFGDKWRDGRINGTVKARAGGNRWLVQWDIDDSETEINTEYLLQLTNAFPVQGML